MRASQFASLIFTFIISMVLLCTPFSVHDARSQRPTQVPIRPVESIRVPPTIKTPPTLSTPSVPRVDLPPRIEVTYPPNPDAVQRPEPAPRVIVVSQAGRQRKQLAPATTKSAPAFFLQPYTDLSPEITNASIKTGWSLFFYDEVNGLKNSNWILGYCWGNAHPISPFYNKATNYDLSSGTSLKFITQKENYAPPSYSVTKQFTSATVTSDDCGKSLAEIPNHLFKYGYFEIRSRNPLTTDVASLLALRRTGPPDQQMKRNRRFRIRRG